LPESPELVVLSHLRWTFVWQRPQQLVSRLAAGFERVWFVEEPLPVQGLPEPAFHVEEHEHVTRVWLEVPDDGGWPGFDAAATTRYLVELQDLVADPDPTVWIYTPMALDLARSLQPSLLVYDVMDDLAAFKWAPQGLVLLQRQALREADVVFTGGRSLHRSVVERRSSDVHCFPSGVEPEHYATALDLRDERKADRPVAGYVGVIDERLDLDLVAELAAALPDWEVAMVGPVLKLDPAVLPDAPNISYPGPQAYDELPRVMAGFDVALMPFALNEATHSISPTKNLEYLAAGLPVVSTRIADVVADYEGIVDLRDDGPGFAEACRQALSECPRARAERVRPVLQAQHWDRIADRMSSLLTAARSDAASEASA
jgi:glycosyltransferase involved in cell wall biosynthesis